MTYEEMNERLGEFKGLYWMATLSWDVIRNTPAEEVGSLHGEDLVNYLLVKQRLEGKDGHS